MSISYISEKDFVGLFLETLETSAPWGEVRTSIEFFYQRGRTDVIAMDDEGLVLAFEAKLSNWRKALQQAYRNTCFANKSYVLLPKHVALRAFQFSAAFAERGVGICYLENEIVILQEAETVEPIQPALSLRAKQSIHGSGDDGSIFQA